MLVVDGNVQYVKNQWQKGAMLKNMLKYILMALYFHAKFVVHHSGQEIF